MDYIFVNLLFHYFKLKVDYIFLNLLFQVVFTNLFSYNLNFKKHEMITMIIVIGASSQVTFNSSLEM